jgi:tripartite-type tricarboxylate transporter receptor subunit TctC
MKEPVKRKTSIAIIVVTALIAVAVWFGSTTGQRPTVARVDAEDSAASFFDGAVIKLIVSNHPGGGYDGYARLIAPYLEKYTGARVRVRNLPGAGGIRGVSELFRSPPDGLTIGLINGSSMVTNEIAEISVEDYAIGDLSLLGRVVRDIRVLTVSDQKKYPGFTDLLNAKTTIRVAATGLGGSTYVDAVVSRDVFNLNMNIVHGFESSSAMRQAMIRGKIDASWTSWGSAREIVHSGQLKAVLQGGRTRAASLSDVPTVFEFMDETADPFLTQEILAAWEALNDVGRAVVAPPGIQTDKLVFLREAFRQAMHDQQFLNDAARSGRLISYASGKEMEDIVGTASHLPADLQQHFVSAVRSGLQ